MIQIQIHIQYIIQQYWELRDEVVASEQLLLRALNFDLHVEHPHKYLLNYLKSLNGNG